MRQYVFKAQQFKAIELPRIEEKRGKEWVDYGFDNLYPNLLIDLFNTSAMHHTCIEAKVDAVIGEGIKTFGSTLVNSHGETLDEIFEKITKDYELFGGYSLNVIWTNDGANIAEIYHLPFNNVRSGKLDENEKVEEYWYCQDWTKHRKYPPISYAPYSTTDNRDENASQVFYFFDYTIGQFYYPLPSYVGALNDIDIDARVSRFHANNLKNGLAPSMMLTFRNGIPTPDEQQEIWRDVEQTFAGEENAGRFFLNFSEPGREPQVNSIENANSDYYITLEERIASRILTAHRITSPLLLGIKDSAGFSSNADEIKVAYAHFVGTVIRPDRKKILDSLNKIFTVFGYNVKLEVIPAEILILEDGKLQNITENINN